MIWAAPTEGEGITMRDVTYGYPYSGMDPRDFRPDVEVCTPAEIAAWHLARKQAAAGEPWDDPKPPDPVYGVYYSGSRWGMGVVTWPDDTGPDGGERLGQTA